MRRDNPESSRTAIICNIILHTIYPCCGKTQLQESSLIPEESPDLEPELGDYEEFDVESQPGTQLRSRKAGQAESFLSENEAGPTRRNSWRELKESLRASFHVGDCRNTSLKVWSRSALDIDDDDNVVLHVGSKTDRLSNQEEEQSDVTRTPPSSGGTPASMRGSKRVSFNLKDIQSGLDLERQIDGPLSLRLPTNQEVNQTEAFENNVGEYPVQRQEDRLMNNSAEARSKNSSEDWRKLKEKEVKTSKASLDVDRQYQQVDQTQVSTTFEKRHVGKKRNRRMRKSAQPRLNYGGQDWRKLKAQGVKTINR